MPLSISTIIPSYNGAHKLERTLQALVDQAGIGEVIVVLDGSTDNSLEIVKAFKTRISQLIIIAQPNGGRAFARNEGAKAATGDILLFIDDDIEVLLNNLSRHLEFHSHQSHAVLVGSPRLPQDFENGDAFLYFRLLTERKWLARFNLGLHQVTFKDYVFTTQNLSLSKQLFLKIGMFDERLTDSEDFDLSVRLLRSGHKIFFDPNLRCVHHDFANLFATIKRQSQYYQSKIRLIELHPDYISLLPSQYKWLEYSILDALKEIIYTNPLTENLIIRSDKLMRWIPEKIRNNLYSSFVYCKTVLPEKRKIQSDKLER